MMMHLDWNAHKATHMALPYACLQCEKYKKSAEQAKEALSAKEQQLKETSKDSIKVEKDRCDVQNYLPPVHA